MYFYSVKKQKRKVRLLGLLTLLVMPALGALLIHFFSDFSFIDRLRGPYPWWKQVLLGVPLGLTSAWGAKYIIDLPKMKATKHQANTMIASLSLTKFDMVFLSFCAAVGEELLFRGAIQGLILPFNPLLAILGSSILFVSIHGYLNPKAGKVAWYGIYLVVVVSIWGTLSEEIGILVAIVAHFIVDVFLFFSVAKEAEKTELPLFYEQETE